MALITEFERATKDRPIVHRPTRCTYCDFIGPDGKRYLILDTYGSCDRAMPDKVSQSVQLDEQGAGRVLQIIRETFPNLR